MNESSRQAPHAVRLSATMDTAMLCLAFCWSVVLDTPGGRHMECAYYFDLIAA
jgi:hypothetical protein